MKEEGCEVVRSLHVPGRCLFLPVSVREELGEGGREGGWEDGKRILKEDTSRVRKK